MTMEALRKTAARMALAVAMGTGLMMSTGVHAAPAAPTREAEIDAFLNGLERTAQAPQEQTAAKPAPASATAEPSPVGDREVARSSVARVEVSTPAVAARASVDQGSAYALQTVEDQSPFRTLLLMFGGIAICALATVGLTLAMFALRKDLRQKRRARQRRFVPYPPRRGSEATQP